MSVKKWISTIMILSLMITVGCSSQPAASSKNESANGKVTLTLWYWNKSIDDNLLAQASKQFPNIELKTEKIGGDFKAKLTTTMAAGAGGPDIIGLNSWVGEFFPNANKFVNLYDLGAKDLEKDYLKWKWSQSITPDGKSMIALPMDTGPTALFYRQDLFQKAGLPTEPADVSAKLKTWEDYIEAGKKVKAATNAYMFDTISTVFSQAISQNDKVYFDTSDKFIGDQEHIKRAWDYAATAQKFDLGAKLDRSTPEWNAALSNGSIASFTGAVWMKSILKDASPDTAGKWRVARAPGGDGNNGGSFIGILKTSKYPKEAFQVIKWLTNPENQLQAYTTMDLFPSTPSVYTDAKMARPEEYFGGQKTGEIFSKAAENIKVAYRGPKYSIADTVFMKEELPLVEKQGKDPEKSFNDAIAKIKKELSR
jgi:cellobiose transport system substrate-binding protein